MEFYIVLTVAGLLAGMLGGLLGIGGGILLMPVLRFFVGLGPPQAAGACIVAVFFTTIGGSYRHYRLGHINLKSLLPFIASGALATAVFSLVFLYFTARSKWLDLGTGVVFSLVSLRMIAEGLLDWFRKRIETAGDGRIRGPLSHKLLTGLFAGMLPGLLGIGTGAVLVPVFSFLFRAPIQIAIGSSLACFSINAFLSALFKLLQGYIIVGVTVPMCIGTLLGSNIGAVLNRRFPSPSLKVLFGIVFVVIGLKYVFLFAGE